MEKRDEDRKWMSSGDGGQDVYRSEAGRNGRKTIVFRKFRGCRPVLAEGIHGFFQSEMRTHLHHQYVCCWIVDFLQ